MMNSNTKNRTKSNKTNNTHANIRGNTHDKILENSYENPSSAAPSILKESDQLIKELTKHLPPPSSTRPIHWDIICSIFEPGVNPGLMIAIHFSFVSLALVHVWLLWLTEGKDWFVWGLLALNVVLYPCLLSFIHLVYKQ
jgi:hypothetical protein